MPKLEPKVVQKELDQGYLWPVYWLYGQERMKSRELLKRIRTATLGADDSAVRGGGLLGLAEETLDGAETDAESVLQAALSPSLGGGTRLIIVRDAHALKSPEVLGELLQPRGSRDSLASVCVFLSKDLDGRKKFSKLLVEKAAVVPCDEVLEGDREPWIQYLAKRRAMELPPELVAQLVLLDPWNLDIIDQELEKISLAQEDGKDVALEGIATLGGADVFMNAFFARDLQSVLVSVERFANQPDESLPLLGLLAWNVRHLALILSDRAGGGRGVKLNPYAAEKLQRWSRNWNLEEVLDLQAELAELDFGFKQTPLLPLGLWGKLAIRFCVQLH